MKRLNRYALYPVVAAFLLAGMFFINSALASYDHNVLNPNETDALVLGTDTDGVTCRVLAADVTNGRPIYIDCADFAALGGEAFTGAVTFGSTVGVTGATTLSSTLTVTGATTLSGDVTGDGGDQLSGFLSLQVAGSTTELTAAQCGSTIVSDGAAVQPLPEASTVLGCRYTFVCGTADDFDINPDDADIIGPVSTTNGTTAVVTLTPSAGDAIRCTDVGSSITLEAIAADRWAQVGGGNGVWTDVN